MKHPNENWLKYLLSQPGMTNAKIISLSEVSGFQPPSVEDLRAFKATLTDKPSALKMATSVGARWLQQHKIFSIYKNDEHMKGAREILAEQRSRRAVEMLVLADTPREEIPKYCKILLGHEYSITTIKLFEHYFWNRELLSYKDWDELLKFYDEYEVYISCYANGPEYALWKLGYRLDVSKDELVSAIKHEAQMRYFETHTHRNTRDTAIKAKLWSETVFRALEEQDKSGDVVQKILAGLKDISIRLDEQDIPSIDDILKKAGNVRR